MPAKGEAAMEQDFSTLVVQEIPGLRQLAAAGNLAGALDGLYLLEKQTRQGGDFTSCARVAREIVRVCFEAANWSQLNESLNTISKRRAQSKTVIQASVQEAMSFLDQIEDKKTATDLIQTLTNITEGKIFVELESAELTRRLAEIYEREGDLKKAAKVLQEVQVETLSKMERKDKINYILEQVRLCLASNDFIRAHILSRKINTTVLNQPEYQKEKLLYYKYMIQYYENEENYLEIARSYQSIYNTPSVQEDKSLWSHFLKLLCIYTVLASHSLEQHEIINRTFVLKQLNDLPLEKQLLKQFINIELMEWPKVQAAYQDELNSFTQFSAGEAGKHLWEVFHLRVVEHNIRVIATYYKRIRVVRLCELLALPNDIVEKRLSDLVVKGMIYAKIDRPAGIINFSKPEEPVEILNNWKYNISDLLNLVEKTCHLIQRENMVQQAKANN